MEQIIKNTVISSRAKSLTQSKILDQAFLSKEISLVFY